MSSTHTSPRRRRQVTSLTSDYARTLRPYQTRQEAVGSIFANGFPYSKKLSSHHSCVNALAFSNRGGRFLASGGDDLKIHLWDFYREDVDLPVQSFTGPRANVFTLAFSSSNRYLFSGGTDSTIYKYDLTRLESISTASSSSAQNLGRPDHTLYLNDSVRAISCHPYQDETFLSATDDGRVIRHDARAPATRRPRAQDTIQFEAEVTSVQHHPLTEHIFVSSDGDGVVALRDTRMAFGPSERRTNQGVVQLYNTKLCRKNVGHLSNPEAGSVVFDRDGTKLAVTFLHYLPTIYALSDPQPLAVCSGRNLPDGSPSPPGARTYSNSCTMKHGSFGGPGLDIDEFYCNGSDDFRGYVWKIPPLDSLKDQRREVSVSNWASNEPPGSLAFTQGFNSPRYIPVEIPTPLFRLGGHRSIVNNIVIHPHLPHIVTCGVERHILLHSPTASSPCTQSLERTPSTVRNLSQTSGEEEDRLISSLLSGESDPATLTTARTGPSEESSGDDSEDDDTIRLFDRILRLEGEADLFDMRRWDSSSDYELSDGSG